MRCATRYTYFFVFHKIYLGASNPFGRGQKTYFLPPASSKNCPLPLFGDFLGYLQPIEAGETLVIIRGGKPVAEIKPTLKTPDISRPFGLCA